MKRIVVVLLLALTFSPEVARAGGSGTSSSASFAKKKGSSDRYERGEHTKNKRGSTWDKHSGRNDPSKEKKKQKSDWVDRSGKRKNR